jgi:hypothetical protein
LTLEAVVGKRRTQCAHRGRAQGKSSAAPALPGRGRWAALFNVSVEREISATHRLSIEIVLLPAQKAECPNKTQSPIEAKDFAQKQGDVRLF